MKGIGVWLCSVLCLVSCTSGKYMTGMSADKRYVLASVGKERKIAGKGIARVRKYDFYHVDVPESFDGFRIAFASDLHYKSKFKDKGLTGLVETVNALDADVFLLGGDYQEGCEYVPELVKKLSEIKTRFGTIGVMGNNDYERCHDEITGLMKQSGIRILEHENDTLAVGEERIIISGVRNPFNLPVNGCSPSLGLNPDDFVILLTHTPDYAEDVDVSNTDLALAGHTHGGQVTLFGWYAPQTNSRYGQRFRSGKKMTTKGVPVIITNGLGTSRVPLRLFAPSEVVLITLHRQK